MSFIQVFTLFGVFIAVTASPTSKHLTLAHVRVHRVNDFTTEAPETTTPHSYPTSSEAAAEHRRERAKLFEEAKSRGILPSPVRLPSHRDDGLSAGHVLVHSPFSCNGLKDGHYADANYDCRFFHNCHFYHNAEGRLYIQHSVFKCGDGTRFNQTTRTCDYEQNVRCNPDLIRQIIEYQLNAPTPPPGYSDDIRIPATSFRCPNTPSSQGFYYADVETGCSTYHRCVYSTNPEDNLIYVRQHSFFCPTGTIFDQRTISCQHADQVPSCYESPSLVSMQASLH